VWELSGKTGRREWTYVGGEINNPTPTGFYTRKAVDPSLDPFGAGNATTQWIEIRYAEVLLNLAEAANAIGHTQEAYDQLKLLRARAGIDPGADGLYGLDAGLAGDQMQAAIMLERRIEFAFEAKRYWDLRRNMRFEPELNGTRPVALAQSRPAARIDWPTFLARQDLVWERLPTGWGESAFIGNGRLGATIDARDGALGWTINRTAVVHDQSRYPIGRVVLKTAG